MSKTFPLTYPQFLGNGPNSCIPGSGQTLDAAKGTGGDAYC